MSEAIRRVRITVRGRVQGVFYRASTRRQAAALGLTGWVENQGDGSVRLEAQGRAADVERLAAWCRQGPPAARVTACQVEELAAVADETGFAVRR
jgi:acylphosphatase